MPPAFLGLGRLFGTSGSSAEQNFKTPSAADSSQYHFDDAHSPPALAHSRLRTGSSLDHHRYSLFSPRRHTDPAAYTETPSSPMRPQQPELPRRGARTSPENLTGFLPDYRTPRDAVPVSVHIPGSASTSSSTQRHKKPGASGEFVPRNTLSHTSPHKAPEYNAPRTYNGARSHFRGLQFGSTTGDNVRRPKTSPSFPDEDYLANPRKRQKISEPRSSSTHIVDLTDESPAEAKTPLVRRTSTQDSNIRDHFAQSAAPRSSGSAHSGVSGAFVLESFHNVDARMNPKDYAGPRRSSDSAAGLPANDSGPLVHATGSPEETKLRKKFILDELLDSIQGDANPNPSSAKKKLLGQKFAATSRKAALEVDELASDPLEGSSNQHGLPSGSQRKIGRNHNGTGAPTTSAPKSTHEKTHAGRSVTLIDDSEDELQLEVPRALPPKQRETTVRAMNAANSPYFDGASEADQSHRPSKRSPGYDTGAFKGDIKPSSFTSRKGAKSAQALSRWPESGIKRWRLKMFKMPRTGPVTGNNVWLVYYPEQKHFLLISDDHPVLIGPKMASVTNSLVNRMLYGNGESTKVFLTGPQVGSQDHYKRFLEFMDTKDRDSFVHFLRCSTPLRSLEKPGKHMDGIFARADLDPTWNPVSEVVDAGQEEAYLESRAHPHRQEAVERSGDKERAHDKGSTSASATTEKPHSKTKLISQMQSGSSRPETSTRTSRAVRVAEEALEMSNFQALGNARSTRSSNRAERPDKAVEYAERIENSPEPERQWPPIQFPEVAWKHPLVYPPTGRQRAQVEWEDLHKLRDGEFLNDSIIAFYMTWASKEAEQRGALSPNKVYWFNTYFYSTLTKTSRGQKGVNYEGVQRWTSKVDIFTYDYVVIPINEDQHWYLAIVCNLPALARKIESGKIVEEEGSKSEKKAVPKDSLAAQVHELLSDKQETPSEAPKEVGTFGDPMELDLPVRSDGQTGFEIPREQSIVEADALQRPLTPQPRSGRASRSPIQRDEDKEINLLRTGREDASKTSPGGKKGRRKPAAPLKKFDTDQPVIIMLDSLGLPHSKTSRNLKEYLVREGKSKRGLDIDTKDFQGMTAKEIPLQDNFCDCGVFVCLYFEKFINEPEAFAHKILRREMDAQKDWPDIQTPKTRRDIMALLTRLQQEQARERKEQKRKKQQGEKKQEDKTDTNGQGTTPVSKQSSPAKIELEPDSKSYKEAPPEELPEHRLDVCPSAPSLPTGSPEIQQQSSPPHLPARNHPRKTHSPKVIAPPPQYLDLEIPHPHHGTSRGPSPHLNGIPKLDLRVPSPINRKRKESSMDHVNHHTAAEHNSEEPIQSIEEMEGVEHSPVHDDDVMLYDENDAEVEKISDSQPQSQPDYLVHAREEHNAFCANLNAVTGSGGGGGGGGAGGVQLETWKERSSSATASQRRRKKKKPEEEAEIIEIDDSQP